MRKFLPFWLMAAFAILFSASSSAQQFSALIDADEDQLTGCSVASADGTAVGIEWRVTATVGGDPPQVTAVERAQCINGSFAAPNAMPAGYPVGFNNGVDGADVVEFAAALAQLTGISREVNIYFLAQSAGGADLLGPLPLTIGSIISAPIITEPAIIPTVHWLGLTIIFFAVLLLARRHRALRGAAAVLMLVGAGLVWAANFIPDGQVGDWATETPLATSPAPSSTDGARDNDIVAVWAADEANRLFFRIDVLDLEDAAPVADDLTETTLENQPLTITLSGSDREGAPLVFSIVQGPANGSLGAITQINDTTAEVVYTPALDFAGNDSFTYLVNDGLNDSAPATVSISVTGINDAPSFSAGPDQTVNEDAGPQTVNPWASNIDDGDAEVVQGLSFEIVSNTNAALFSAAPAVSAAGVLTFTPTADVSGSATITLQLRDDGGTANGGVDVSPTQSFTITVNAVNDAPSFVTGPNQAVDEDAGPQVVDPWATAISAGPADEAGQTLTFTITGNTNPALFSAAPAVSPSGVLSYTPAPSANGSATITLTLSDDGGTANGGVDTSEPQSFTISVNAVNNAPSFTVGPDQIVDEDAGPQLVDPWATNIDDGDPEVAQGLSFEIVGNTNAALFSAGPTVSAAGALSYTTAPDAFGSASITLQLRDDGGTANGGVDVSPTQSFNITVNPVDDPPVAVDDAASVDEDSAATLIDVLANDTDVDGGPISIALVTQPANGTVVISGGGTSVDYQPDPDYCNTAPVAPADSFTYSLAPGGSTATVSVTVNCVNDAPVNSVPGTQQTPDDNDLVFNTLEGNAISVADVDAGTGILQMTFSSGDPANGTLTLANPGGVLATLTGNGSDEVIATGTLTALNLALNGPDGSLTYSPPLGVSAGQTLTITTDDLGNAGGGGPLSDVSTIDISVDAAPEVSSTPANGATIANNAAISLSFSEAVDVTAGTSLVCGGPNLITGGDTGNGVTALNLSYTAPLPPGSCTLTVPAANVSDVDLTDPPDQPLADYVATFSVDAAPEVTATTPADGETVANDVALSVSFSESVDATNAVTLTCGGPNLITGGASGAGVTSLTPSYTAPLPAGACTLTVLAANIDDTDLADPPANPVADTVINFTVDAAPALVSALPAEGAEVGTGQAVSFTFDEPVDDLGGAITLDCGGPIAGAVTGSGTATLTFTPSAALPEGSSCSATAVALSIGDTDIFDPPQNPAADVVRNFSVDAAPTVLGTLPANGAVDVNLDTNITVTFSEPVNFTAAAFSLECPGGSSIAFSVSGDGTDTATIDPTPATLPINTACVFTVDASLVTDVDAADPPDAGSGISTVGFTTVDDNPPSVTVSTPGDGDTVANTVALSISFSEAIDAAVNYATLTCGGPNLITVGQTGSNTSVLSPTYTGPLPNGASCTLTVLAANITDVDLIDPPDGMLADYVVNFSVDAAPEVTSTLPANGAVDVATSSTLTVNFSEAVDIAAGGITLNCGAPVAFNAGPLPASNVTSIVLTPSSALPDGATCNGQVVASLVTDSDAIDPPDQMVANFNWSFSTDAAPEVSSLTPAGAAVVSTTQTITVNFSENVDLSATAFTLDCAGAIAMTGVPALPATNTPSIVLTPTGGLPEGASCVLTVVAAQVTDSDSNDPPNSMLVDLVRNFSVDAAPTVTGTTPANAALDVDPTSNITINFSESVNFDTTANATNTSFDLECPGGSPADFTVLTASPAASVVLNPVDSQVAGSTCSLSVRAAGITDADAIDPPNTMAVDFVASFSYAAVALDDAYTATPHLTLAIGAASPQGGGVLVNDILGSGAITGFGFAPTCTGTAAGNQLDAGAANGRLTLNADGGFSYEPPAAVVNTTRTFCYTVTGGDTANVVFTLQNTELVWFVDAAAAGGGIGTQARPFLNLSAAAAVDTANDTIHLAFNASPYIGGITLEASERLVGSASGSTVATISGINPVAGSAFPALGGSAPTITCAGTCITLGTGNTLRGFIVGNSGLAGTDILGTAFGTLTVGELTLGGDGRALALTTGTLTGNFLDIDVSAGNLDGVALDAVGGTWSVTGQVGIGNVAGTGFSLINAPAAASATLTGGLNVAKTGAGTAVNLASNNAGATIDLGGVSLTAGSVGNPGTGLAVTSSPLTITGAASTISTTAGPAINASAANFVGGVTFATVSSASSTTTGISLATVSGSVSIVAGAISAATGTAFNVDAGSAAVSYGGTITNSAGRSVAVQNRSGTATVGLTGAISDSGTGILLNANAAGSISSFRGGLELNTATNTAFTATTGGTVEVCDENPCNAAATGPLINTLTTTTGTALNVANTTIGAAGMSFRSITSTGASANTAIILSSTGAGAFSVTGTGAAGTGGTISNKTVDAVQLNTTGGLVTLNGMIIEDIGSMAGAIDTRSGHDAIQGLTVNGGLSLTGTTIRRISDQAIHGGIQGGGVDTATVWNGLTLSGVTIENSNRYHVAGSGDANNEGMVRILGIRGAVSITNSTFSLGAQHLDLEVTGGALNLTATGNTFDRSYKEFTSGVRASIGNHCIDVRVLAGATANVTIGDRVSAVLGNNFLNCRIGSVRVVNQPGAGANTDAIIARNNFRVNDHSSGIGGDFDFPMGGVLAWNLSSGTVDTIVENNLFELVTNASGGVGQLTVIAEGGPVQALVQNNTFDRPGNAAWQLLSRNSVASNLRVSMRNNAYIRGAFPCTTDPSCGGGYFGPGIFNTADASGGATLSLTMDNELLARHDVGFIPGSTVEVRSVAPAGGLVCTNFTNNQSPDGYSLQHGGGTFNTVGTGTCSPGSPTSASCATVLGNRGNRGSGGVATANPPLVEVFGTVGVTGTACPVPTGGPF